MNNATSSTPLTTSVAPSGESPRPSRALTPAAPMIPPRLNMPWKPDIMVLPLARSTITACRFTVESTVPSPAPNRNKAATSQGREVIVASNGNARQIRIVPPLSTRRQPNRAASAPEIGIARIDPTPRHNSSNPRVPSSRFARTLA
ncbi:hypothetical protein D3C78_1045760 [compost metagenome]